MRKVLLFVTTVALVVAGMSGTASALSLSATTLVQENNYNCGKFTEGEPIIGSAKFTRTVNKLKVTYKAKHLAKSTAYRFEIYSDTEGTCDLLAIAKEFVTTATGVGSVTGEIEVPEKDYEFFADAYDGRVASPAGNDSFTVVLPKP